MGGSDLRYLEILDSSERVCNKYNQSFLMIM